MSKKTKWLISASVLLLLAVLVEYSIGWKSILATWTQLSSIEILLALIALFSSYAIRATRLIHYFQLTQPSQMLGCARLMLLHNFWNNLLPMRTGEASFPILMKNQFSISLDKSLPALLWFRILDLHSLLLILLIAFASSWLQLTFIQLVIATLLWLSIPILLFISHTKLQSYLTGENKISHLILKIVKGLPQTNRQFFWSWFWTQINWAVKLIALAWILSWFIDLTIMQALLGVIGGELTSVLPIHGIGGFGTYEAGVWLALSPFSEQQTVIFSAAINLHLMVISSSLLSAIIAMSLPKR